jgi:ABC-2 type transport system ATP-binding protein
VSTVIEVKQLSHQFGNLQALQGMTFSVEKGEVFGFIGPNGAGKTTTVRILNGLLTPSGGSVFVLGLFPGSQGSELRRRTGVLTETPSIYERLSGRENLEFYGALYGVDPNLLPKRIFGLLEQFGLEERARDKTGTYSKGMKQRLALARALLHEPELLFLDEPTTGLDPEAAQQVTKLITKLNRQQGRTVFLCTHNLDEAQRLCDRVAVINKGHLLALGTLADLEKQLWNGVWVDVELASRLPAFQAAEMSRIPGVYQVQGVEKNLAFQVDSLERVPELVQRLVRHGGQLQRVNPRKHTLEEIYFEFQQQPEEPSNE